jgi:hypothetical protein
VLSKWTKKYKQYKQLQKKIDEKLDYDIDNEEGKGGEQDNNRIYFCTYFRWRVGVND